MTAPGLPMRERIAEALFNHLYDEAPDERRATWAGQPEGGEIRSRFLARAGAVLTVLADLPDTAVEAGGRALTEPEPIPGAKTLGCARHHRVIFNNGCPACNKEARAALTSAIAAVKEGKA